MNKITCICLGVRNMSLAIRFYRDGLGFETCEKDTMFVDVQNNRSSGRVVPPLAAGRSPTDD